MASESVPLIDISSLHDGSLLTSARRQACVAKIGKACRELGFFYIQNHGVCAKLEKRLEDVTKEFFALPSALKRKVEMARAGKTWRGFFELGEEHTGGVVDEKEGYYFGAESSNNDDCPLHGPNLFPSASDGFSPDLAREFRTVITEYMSAMTTLSHTVLAAIAGSLGLDEALFGKQFLEPTTVFSAFHYPPHDEEKHPGSFAVGEHTDYGYIIILKQDQPGLQVRSPDGKRWVSAPPIPNTFVVNLGDALQHNTGSLLRATPHRVATRHGATGGRYSFPFFFDPSFNARLDSVVPYMSPELQKEAAKCQAAAASRRKWDGKGVEHIGKGTYGDYLMAKLSTVFPKLIAGTQRARL